MAGVLGWERTHGHARLGRTQGHAGWGGTHCPPQTRGGDSAGTRPLPASSRGEEADAFSAPRARGAGVSRVRGQTRAGTPKSATAGALRHSRAPRRPRGVVTKFVETNLERARGSAAATRGRRDEWPEGMGWAPPAAAQMFLRGTPPLLWSPLGRAGPEGARGGGSCSPLVSQLNN